jgi:hypothetical protein
MLNKHHCSHAMGWPSIPGQFIRTPPRLSDGSLLFASFDMAFDLIFVHDDLLVMTVDHGAERRTQVSTLAINKKA